MGSSCYFKAKLVSKKTQPKLDRSYVLISNSIRRTRISVKTRENETKRPALPTAGCFTLGRRPGAHTQRRKRQKSDWRQSMLLIVFGEISRPMVAACPYKTAQARIQAFLVLSRAGLVLSQAGLVLSSADPFPPSTEDVHSQAGLVLWQTWWSRQKVTSSMHPPSRQKGGERPPFRVGLGIILSVIDLFI